MATRLINSLGESQQLCYKCGQLGCSYWNEHRALVLNSQRQIFWRLAGESCGTTNMVISCVAYSYTNRQKTGSNIYLFSINLCHKCLYCVSVYVNECNSFGKILKYQFITDKFVFLGGSVH